jgi:NAD-dependent DNA ligase
MKICYKCQVQNESDASFCKACGYRLEEFQPNSVIDEVKIVKRAGNPRWADISPEEFDALKADLLVRGFIPNTDHQFFGKNLAISLFLESMTEPVFWLAIALVGGNMKKNVSKVLNYLVEGNDPTGKYQKGKTTKSLKARELISSGCQSLTIIDESELLSILGEDVVVTARSLTH